ESVDGEKTVYELFSPQQAMYIPPMYWRKIVPSDDAIIICLASEKYYPEDYIIDYSEFKNSTSSNLQ
ncbi:MAG: WxcM-like domain-containing protein, partial [Cyclobacteriaceae bacterium]